MNAHKTPMLRTFKPFLLYDFTLQKSFQLNHNIVIAMSLNHLTIGETQDNPSPPPSSLLHPKGTPSLTHMHRYL